MREYQVGGGTARALVVEKGVVMLKRTPRTAVLGHFQPSLRDWSALVTVPRTAPDFLYAALDTSAYAAFFTESRTRLSDSNKLHRKSGSVLGYSQPSLRDSIGESSTHTPSEAPRILNHLRHG
jgi:hypothetical protein